MTTTEKPREVKCVLLGDTGVGKSSLVLRFVTNNFKPYSESTVRHLIFLTVDNSVRYSLWLWLYLNLPLFRFSRLVHPS